MVILYMRGEENTCWVVRKIWKLCRRHVKAESWYCSLSSVHHYSCYLSEKVDSRQPVMWHQSSPSLPSCGLNPEYRDQDRGQTNIVLLIWSYYFYPVHKPNYVHSFCASCLTGGLQVAFVVDNTERWIAWERYLQSDATLGQNKGVI